jgi:hypothetical protein
MDTSRFDDRVVAEILSSGGGSVAHFHSVEGGESIVLTARDHFYRVFDVMNSARFLDDLSFAKMTEQGWALRKCVPSQHDIRQIHFRIRQSRY